MLDDPQQRSISMASKWGQKRPKIKMNKMILFWNLVMNIVCEDSKNAKIIEMLQLGKAVLTLKFNIFTTVGSMLYSLTLSFDFYWGQTEAGWNFFGDDINQ